MIGTIAQLLLVSAALDIHSVSAVYTLVEDYSGNAFFRGFNFFTDADPTNGHVTFQSLKSANDSGLAGFLSGGNSSRAIYMGVDADKPAPRGRDAIRVSSQQTFQHALVIADIVHMPGVCGTWPAFWMLGEDWPNNGEIDIVEGVNDQTSNQMTLHTNTGPVLNKNVDFTGKILTQDCDVNAKDQDKNAGCSIADQDGLTFGEQFNANGGGVFATEWTSDFIKIWFFPRGQFPADVVDSTPLPPNTQSANNGTSHPSTWGPPNAFFSLEPGSNVSLDSHFRNLSLIFDTTFCGDWAGRTWSDTPSCAALAPTCEDYVANNPEAFVEAFWAVNTLLVFQDDGVPSAPGNGSLVRRTANTGRTIRRGGQLENASTKALGLQAKYARQPARHKRHGGAVLSRRQSEETSKKRHVWPIS